MKNNRKQYTLPLGYAVPDKSRTILLGTDWWTDCDDVAAVRIACRADACGLWHLTGVVCNGCME